MQEACNPGLNSALLGATYKIRDTGPYNLPPVSTDPEEESPVKLASPPRWPAWLCAASLPVCALIVRPYAETGIIDDGPYIRTAQLLAQTGHVVYNGWAAAMLGWQLFVAAALIRVFGFSFTVARSSMLLVAMATAFLLQRIFVRAGIRPWNATLGALVVVLSPLFLALSFTFMTDIAGVFVLVVCLYGCIRAVQAATTNAALAWLIFAAISSVIGGTARQTGWLGLLVLVPSAAWLRRPRRLFVWAAVALWVFGIAGILGLLRWFYRQPYDIHEQLIRGPLTHAQIKNLVQNAILAALTFATLMLPALLLLLPGAPMRGRRAVRAAGAAALVCLLAFVALALRGNLIRWLIPLSDWFSFHGAASGLAIQGLRPALLPLRVRVALTGVLLPGIVCLGAFLVATLTGPARAKSSQPGETCAGLSWDQTRVLLVPFVSAYMALLVPRAINDTIYDRYLLVLVAITVLVLLRLYQERVQPCLPGASLAVVVLIAAYSIASSHDTFAMFRARLASAQELRAAGVPDTQIDAGFDANTLAEIDRTGHLNDPRIVVPQGAYVPPAPVSPRQVCPPQFAELLPSIRPHYALSFDPSACGGPSTFAPVRYREWLGPRSVAIYIVDVPY
jgi:hypothetical protein